jgi:hypothetical protein
MSIEIHRADLAALKLKHSRELASKSDALRARYARELAEKDGQIAALRAKFKAEVDARVAGHQAKLQKVRGELAERQAALAEVEMFSALKLGLHPDLFRSPNPTTETPQALLARYEKTSDPAERDRLRATKRAQLEEAFAAALLAEKSAAEKFAG